MKVLLMTSYPPGEELAPASRLPHPAREIEADGHEVRVVGGKNVR